MYVDPLSGLYLVTLSVKFIMWSKVQLLPSLWYSVKDL